MTKSDAIDLAIEALETVVGTWQYSMGYINAMQDTEDAIEILEKIKKDEIKKKNEQIG